MFAMMLSAPHQALEPVHRPDPAPRPGFSAANLTRQDGLDYLPMAAAAGVRPRVTLYPLSEANRAVRDLREAPSPGPRCWFRRPTEPRIGERPRSAAGQPSSANRRSCNTICREPDMEMARSRSSWVRVRETVSMVRPR